MLMFRVDDNTRDGCIAIFNKLMCTCQTESPGGLAMPSRDEMEQGAFRQTTDSEVEGGRHRHSQRVPGRCVMTIQSNIYGLE